MESGCWFAYCELASRFHALACLVTITGLAELGQHVFLIVASAFNISSLDSRCLSVGLLGALCPFQNRPLKDDQ